MLMMGGNRKKMAELIVAGIPGSKSLASDNEKAFKSQADAGSEKVDEGQLEAARALISAIKSDNPHQLALALQDVFDLFDQDDDSEEESEEPSEE